MINAGGTIQARYEYDPYGRRTKVSGASEADFAYTGHYFHQKSGLHLAPYRQYDAEVGKWLSRDPISEIGGLNLYAYVNNGPLVGVDPLGLISWSGLATHAIGVIEGGAEFAVGLGDTATFGATTYVLEKLLDGLYGESTAEDFMGRIDCSRGAAAGEIAGLVVGIGRLGYAGAAKAGSISYARLGATEANAIAAVALRNTLKKAFRANPLSKYKIHSFEAMMVRHNGNLARIIQAAGKTNRPLNIWAAAGVGYDMWRRSW